MRNACPPSCPSLLRSSDRGSVQISTTLVALAVAALAAAGCDDARPEIAEPDPSFVVADPGLVRTVRELAAARDIGPLPAPPNVRPALARLGQALAFDPILSGNRNISCMTCHLPAHATGDGKSLSVGEGGTAMGPGRTHPEGVFIARNAPPLFNLHTLDKLFWDGRVSVDEAGFVHSPAGTLIGAAMQATFEFGAISALGMFPVTNREEMRGRRGTNDLADIDDADFRRIWRGLMRRLGEIPEYRAMFEDAYPGTAFREMTFAHASNAMAGFFLDRFHFARSPWDRFLAGEDGALEPVQLRGARSFLSARCSICHGGPAFTDNGFHNVALAQVGPGAGDGLDRNDDFGRARVTGEARDRYAFRSTPLRNVELTAPYGHAGQFMDLEAFVDHYSESELKLASYDVNQLEPSLRSTLVPNFADVLATRDPLLDGVVFPPEIIREVTEYLRALTDPAARDLMSAIPARVPSGLPVDR